MKKCIKIIPNKVFIALLAILGVLILLNFLSIYMENYMNVSGKSSYVLRKYVVTLFDFDGERNIPTFFSTLILLASGVLLYYISKVEKTKINNKYHKRWFILSCVFIFLAMDELLMIHELFSGLHFRAFYSHLFNTEQLGVFHSTWIIPYLILLIFLGIYYFKFIFSLPKNTMLLFIVSGTIFVTGAVGIEMIEGFLADKSGEILNSTVHFRLWVAFEETMEMFGIILFIKALLGYLSMSNNVSNLLLDIHFVNKNDKIHTLHSKDDLVEDTFHA
ncbi:MAG: hypothetical protein M3512_11600 [Bacteroidota bacterium]|nr:hypothetical protein [Bacteroidota bacterium]